MKTLLKVKKRMNTASVLKEAFGQLWDYQTEGWARHFFDKWRDALKWQCLQSYEKFAKMIYRYWDGIAVFCKPENKVARGFVVGVGQQGTCHSTASLWTTRRGLSTPKVFTCMLPQI